MNTQVDGCQFLCIKTFKTQLFLTEVLSIVVETYFSLIFRDYSAEEHCLKGDAGVWEAAPLENSHVVFGSLEIFTASGIGSLNCSNS